MIVDDNYLSAEGIEKNIDWETLNAENIKISFSLFLRPMINLNMQDALCSSVLWIISKSLWIMPILSRR